MASCGKLLRHIKVIPFQVFHARLIKQRRERRIWFCLKIGFDKFDCLSGFIMVEHPPILFHGQSLVVHKKKSFAVYGYFPLIATQPTGFKHVLTCLNHPSSGCGQSIGQRDVVQKRPSAKEDATSPTPTSEWTAKRLISLGVIGYMAWAMGPHKMIFVIK